MVAPGMPIQAIEATQIVSPEVVQGDVTVTQQLVKEGVINSTQASQIIEQIQAQIAEETSTSVSEYEVAVREIVDQTLTEVQQEDFESARNIVQEQIRQELSVQEQIQQDLAKQEMVDQKVVQQQIVQQQIQQQIQQDQILQEQAKVKTAETTSFAMPPIWPFGVSGWASLEGGGGRGARRSGTLFGERGWLMPGLVLELPDPFGIGKQRIQLAKKKKIPFGARRKGARARGTALVGVSEMRL